MNKRIICIALLPFAAGCILRLKGEGLYLFLFALFSIYMISPALMLKDKKRAKREVLLRIVVITVSFACGYIRTANKEDLVKKITGSVENGGIYTEYGRVVKEKSDGSAIVVGNSLVYMGNALVCDENGGSLGEIKPGDMVKAEGKSYVFDTARNEGEFDSFEYYISQKIYRRVNADRIILMKRPVFSIAGVLWDTKNKIREVYVKNLPPVQAALVCAMALGDKSLLDDELTELYRVSGISHILVISGLHISLIGLLLYRLLQGRTAIVTAAVLAACGLVFYCALTGFSVSAVRACAMFVMYLCAAALGCGYDGLSAWSIALFALLMFEPMSLYGSGFVLSFYQTGFIMCVNELKGRSPVGSKLYDRTEKDPLKRLCNRMEAAHAKAKDGFEFTVIMTLASYPVIACFYYELPVYSVAVNYLLLPAMGFVMAMAVAGGIAGLIFPAISRLLLYPVKIILGADTYVCELVKKLPASLKVCGFPGKLRLCVYFVIFAAMLVFLFRCGNKRKRGAVFVTGTFILVVLLVLPQKSGFEMDFLDVGQGDGIYIKTSEEKRLFIDGGSSSEKSIGKYTIMPFLKYKGIDSIDYWFVSHLDSDHYNGLSECIRSGYVVKNIVLSEDIVKDEDFEKFTDEAEKHGVNVMFAKCGDSLAFRDTVIKVLSPERGASVDDKNARSMVLLYRDDKLNGDSGFRAFLGGDIDSETEMRILENRHPGKVTVYKASHHGSKYSNSKEMLDELSPDISVVSCSLENKYGHPGAEAVINMTEAGSEIFYTMYSGRIRIGEKRGKIYADRYIKSVEKMR